MTAARPRWALAYASSAVFLLLHCCVAQSQDVASPRTDPPPDILLSRLEGAAKARQSGDPEAITRASELVIAAGLRDLAAWRHQEGVQPGEIALLRWAALFEQTAETRLQLALAYFNAGLRSQALDESSAALQQDAENAAAWNLRGKLLLLDRKFCPASASLQKSLDLQFDPEVAYTAGTAMLSCGEKQRAIEVFQRLQAVAGDRADLHVMVGRAYEAADLNEGAEQEYKRAIAIDAKASRAHYFLGLLYLTKNGWEPTADARREFLAEVAENPEDFFGNYFMGYLTSGEKQYEVSDAYLKKAAAAKPNWPEPFLYMGLNAYGASSYQAAEILLRKAIELTGSDEARNNYQVRRAHFALGRILINTERKDEGTKHIQRSREMETKLVVNGREHALDSNRSSDPTHPAAADANTNVAPAIPTPADAAAAMSRSAWDAMPLDAASRKQAEAADRGLRVILGNALNDLGASEARRRQYKPALEHFQQAALWNANVDGLSKNIGLAAFLSEDYSTSARALRKAVDQDPADLRAQSMLAASLAKIGDRQHASEVLAKLVVRPIPAEMLVRAGEVYSEIGEPANAQLCLQRAKELDPSLK